MVKFSKATKDRLIKGYEEAFESEDLKLRFYIEYNELYENIIRETLSENGYPDGALIEKVDVDIEFTPKSGYEAIVDRLEEEEKIDSKETFANVVDDLNFYISDILEHLREVNIRVKFKADPTEYLEQYPTASYLAKEMERQFDEHKLMTYLHEDENFLLETVIPQAEEEGIEVDNPSDVKYTIQNAEVSDSYSNLADRFLSEGVIEEEQTVTGFMSNQFYQIIVKEKLYQTTVRIDMEPEDEVI